MKRSDLINLLMNKHKYLTFKEVESLIDIVFSEMSSSLINGGRVELRGFGSFSTTTSIIKLTIVNNNMTTTLISPNKLFNITNEMFCDI